MSPPKIATRSSSLALDKSDPPKISITEDELEIMIQKATQSAIATVRDFFNEKLEEQQSIINEQRKIIDSQQETLRRNQQELEEIRGKLDQNASENNRLEQYSRHSHLRLYGLKYTGDCKDAVAAFISRNLKSRDGAPLVVTVKDIDAAHPLPVRNRNTPPTGAEVAPIIVRFHARDVRDAVIRARKQLKGNVVSIAEDLTSRNAKLLRKLRDMKDYEAWSWEGKIYAKHKNDPRARRYDIFDI